MTVGRSTPPVDVEAADAPPVGAIDASEIPALETPTLDGVRIDRISLSPRAITLVAAGSYMPAIAISGLEELHRRVALDRGRTLVLDGGLYRLDFAPSR